MRIRRAFAVTACVAVVATAMPAAAHDHRPPRTRLTSRDASQAGQQSTYCWTSAGDNPGEAIGICADYAWDFPRAERAHTGAMASIKFKSSNKPTSLHFSYWREVDQNGEPKGKKRDIDYSFRAVREAGEIVAYRARFRLPQRRGHMYIWASGTWEDQDAGGGSQDSSWTFHLRLR